MEKAKCLIVGDGSVGKTSMLIMYMNDTFPDDYIPTVLSGYSMIFSFKDKTHRLEFFDTAGQEEYAHLRPISYNGTDVFFLCFSIVDPNSFSNVELVWNPEIRHFSPNAMVILVGTKFDLRNDETTIHKLKKIGKSPVTYKEGEQLAMKIKADMYFECSALRQIGVKEAINSGISAFFERKEKPIKKRICSIS